jgi:hypothetical protein
VVVGDALVPEVVRTVGVLVVGVADVTSVEAPAAGA